MAKVSFAELEARAIALGIEDKILNTARELEEVSDGLGGNVLVTMIKKLSAKVDHAAQFVNSPGGAIPAAELYQALLNIYPALDEYSKANRTMLTLDWAALKEGVDTMDSKDGNPVAAMFTVSRRKSGEALNPRPVAGEPQTTPADVAALAAYLIKSTGTEPEVYMNIAKGAIRKSGTLMIDGAIVADEDDTENGGKTFTDYRDWHAHSYPDGGSPSKIVGVVTADGEMSLEKAVRLARDAGHLTPVAASANGNGNGHEDAEVDDKEEDDGGLDELFPVTAGGGDNETPVATDKPPAAKARRGR